MTKLKAIAELQDKLPPGSMVYTCRVNHGSESKRQYLVLRVSNDRSIYNITWMVAIACDIKRSEKSGGIPASDSADLIALLAIRLGYDYKDLQHLRLN